MTTVTAPGQIKPVFKLRKTPIKRPTKDGLSATAYPSGIRGTPVEINETVAPLIFHTKEYRQDSGGAGLNRGGLGQIIEISSAINGDIELLAAFDRIKFPPRGSYSGEDGDRGSVGLKSGKKLEGKGTQLIKAGERVVLKTPGGAGFGHPKERDPEKVALDLANELISVNAAKQFYDYEG